MRQLNATEKRLADYICRDEEQLICDILKHEFDKNGGNNEWSSYCITTFTGRVEVKSIFDHKGKFGQIAALLMSLFYLIRTLEDSGYIFIHDPYSIKASCKQLGDSNGKITNSVIIPNEIAKELASIWSKQITITEEFKQYVGRRFKTQEDIRYRNQICATWTAIVVSVLIGLAGIWLSCLSLSKEPDYSNLVNPMIDQQIQQMKMLESMNTNLDSIHRQLSISQIDSITLADFEE